MELHDIKKLTISEHRWYAHVTAEMADGTTKKFMLSSLDASGTSGDGHYLYDEEDIPHLDWL